MKYLRAALRPSFLSSGPFYCALILFVGLAKASTPLVAAAASGTISGSVSSSKTHNGLQGAVVSIPALSRSQVTDSSGSFLLQNVPPGPVEVVISYTGFEDERRSLTVRGGESTAVDAEMRPQLALVMEAFTVATEKEGQALAITEQRNAPNIKNVTAMDEWGNMATMNIAELAMRLPGITFLPDEDNSARNVSIRGMDAGFTRLNVDGMSSTGVDGAGRTASLYSLSGAMYEQIEIIAGQTPDKRADSIGGQLNLKTRSPLNMSEKRRFNYNFSARWSPPFAERSQQRADHSLSPITSLSYQEVSDVFGGRRNLGISFNASYTESVNMIVNDNLFYQSTTNPAAFFNDYTTYTGLNHRIVTGLGLRVDYRPSPRSTYSFRVIHNAGAEPYYMRTKIDPLGNGTIATVANGQFTGTGSVVPGFTENRTELRQVPGAAGTRMDLETMNVSFYSRNPTATFLGEHNLGQLKLDYAARASNTHFNLDSGPNTRGGTMTMRAENIGMILDKSNLDGRVFTQTAGPSVSDVASYQTNILLTKRDLVSDLNEWSATINASYLVSTAYPFTIKSGFDTVNRRINNRNNNARRWNRATGAPALSGVPMVISRFEQKNGVRIPTIEPSSVNDQLTNPTLWTEDLNFAAQQPFTGRRLMEEAVDAGYIQGSSRIGRFTLLGGVRAENVKVDTFTYLKLRSTTVAAEPDALKRAKLDYVPLGANGEYTKYFPSVHLGYDITPNLKARSSWSSSYGRPVLAQIIPAVSFNDTTQTVSAGNPALKPQLAKNVDLKLEYVMKGNGLISVGYFEKKITDYIVSAVVGVIPSGPDNGFDNQFAGYTLTSSTNAGEAKFRGWEFDFRQRLDFLPGALKGLYFSANYSVLEATGRFTSTTPILKNNVLGFIPKTGNARLLYTYKRFGASVSANFTGEHLSALGNTNPPENRLYRKNLTTLNASLSYKLRPEATLFLDATNLSQKGPTVYRYIPSRIRQEYLAEMTINVGVSGQF